MGQQSDSGAEEQSRRSNELTQKQIELMKEQEERNKRLEEEAKKEKDEQDKIKAEQLKKEKMLTAQAAKRQVQANKSRGAGVSLLDDVPSLNNSNNIYN